MKIILRDINQGYECAERIVTPKFKQGVKVRMERTEYVQENLEKA